MFHPLLLRKNQDNLKWAVFQLFPKKSQAFVYYYLICTSSIFKMQFLSILL